MKSPYSNSRLFEDVMIKKADGVCLVLFPNCYTLCGKLNWSHYRTLIAIDDERQLQNPVEAVGLAFHRQPRTAVERRPYLSPAHRRNFR